MTLKKPLILAMGSKYKLNSLRAQSPFVRYYKQFQASNMGLEDLGFFMGNDSPRLLRN